MKSFISLDWAACVATAFAWNTRAVNPGRVLYVAAEGAHGLHARLNAWETYRQTTVPDDTLTVLPGPVNLFHADEVAALLAFVADSRFRFVVIDTLARCAVGADENSARDMGVIVDNLHKVKVATGGGAVLADHHTGKDRVTTRGSSALESGVDCVYMTEGGDGEVTLSRTKRKDGPLEDVHHLKFQPIDGTQSGVGIVGIGEVGIGADGKLLSHFIATFGTTGASKTELRASVDMPTSSFYRGLNALVRDGHVVNTGTDMRPHYEVANQS